MGARRVYERFRSLACEAGGEMWSIAACAAICDALRPLLGREGSKKPWLCCLRWLKAPPGMLGDAVLPGASIEVLVYC